VMTILEQGTDVLIPLLVVATECFLYYGWNGDAVPTLVALTPDEFARSTLLKSISMFIQIATAMFSAFCVNNLCVHFWHDCFCRLDMWTHLSDHLRSTTINFMDVMVYEISRHFWKLVVSAASVLVFCYASLMPVRHHTCSLSIPSCHRSLLQLMGLLSLCVCVYNFNLALLVKVIEENWSGTADALFFDDLTAQFQRGIPFGCPGYLNGTTVYSNPNMTMFNSTG
jgi:hypothetical protein